ncbi:MAG: hypothetical protein ACKO96_49280, partial [Flammeovirgaceae bacterium]
LSETESIVIWYFSRLCESGIVNSYLELPYLIEHPSFDVNVPIIAINPFVFRKNPFLRNIKE